MSDDRTITTTATGTASATPDLLRASVEVVTEGSYAADVLAEANKRTVGLLDHLAEAGISAADVRTTSVDVGQRWDQDGRADGYRASNAVRIVLRDLGRAGTHLDSIARLLNDTVRLSGVELDVADPDPLLSAARAEAVRRARAQAQELAAAAGATLGPVQRILEVPNGGGFVPKMRTFAAADAGVPLSPGTHEVSVTVEVAFGLS